MEKSPLRYLKDYDLITILNEEVPKSKYKLAKTFHMGRYKDRLYNNYNFFEKNLIDDTFWRINRQRVKQYNISMIPNLGLSGNFVHNENNTINVKHAIALYQEYLVESEYESNNIRLPCGTISNGAQCLCDICINAY